MEWDGLRYLYLPRLLRCWRILAGDPWILEDGMDGWDGIGFCGSAVLICDGLGTKKRVCSRFLSFSVSW